MIVAHCPRCAEAIRVPSTLLPEDAYAQCPLCRETFAASELLDRLPPVVQFLGADGSAMEFSEAAPNTLGGQSTYESAPHDVADLEQEHDSNPFSDAAGAVMSAGGIAGAAVAAGGAAAMGLAGAAGESEIEELDEIEELLDDEDENGILLNDTHGEDSSIESEVEEFLEEVGQNPQPHEETESSESTLLMDTLDNDGGDYSSVAASADHEVDVEDEVQQFMGAETVEFEPDGADQDSDQREEASDLGAEELVVEEVSFDEDEVSFDGDIQTGVDELVTSAPAATVAPMKVRSRPARPKKKSSPWKTIAGVALGPLLALPLAGGILLALGKAPDLGFWPFLGKADSQTTRLAYNPDDSSPSPSTIPSSTFGQTSSLVSPSSEVGEFVADNENEIQADAGDLPAGTSGDDLPAATLRDDELAAPSVAQELDAPASTGTPDNSDDSEPAFAFPDAGAPSEATDDSTPEIMKDPFGASTNDSVSSDPEVAIEMPAPKGIAEVDAALPDASALDPSLADPRKQAESRASLDSVFGMLRKSTASANKVVVDAESDSATPNVATTGTSDQPLLLRGLPEGTDSDSSPFGDGVSLGGPAETDSPELTEAANKASASIISLLTKRADGSASRKDMARTYATVCRVGAIESNSRSTSLRNLLQEIGQSTLMDDFGGDTVTQWLRYSKRPTPGVLIVGKLGVDADSASIVLSDGKSVTVSMADKTNLPAAGQQVIAIGKISSENQVELNAAFAVQ